MKTARPTSGCGFQRRVRLAPHLLAGLFLLAFSFSCFASDAIEFEDRAGTPSEGDSIRIEFKTKKEIINIYGLYIEFDQTALPGLIGIATDKDFVHLVDIRNVHGKLFREIDGASKPGVTIQDIKPAREDNSPAPVRIGNQTDRSKIQKYLLNRNRRVELVAMTSRFGFFAAAGGAVTLYLTLWDNQANPGAYLYRPAWTAHLSSYSLSVASLSLISMIDWGKNLSRLDQNNRLLYISSSALIALHAILEVKGLAPVGWTQILGPNVSDITDFYVGVGSATAMLLIPFIERGAEFWERQRVIASKCLTAFGKAKRPQEK